jgi:hypothetical protein
LVSIQQILSQWDEEVHASQEVKLAFMQPVFDFFIRINDPKEASIWLQKLGQLSSSGTSNPMDCISSLITAWSAVGHDSQAPWRVDELLQ